MPDDPTPEVLEALVEATNNVEDEGKVRNDLVEVNEGVSHGAHATAVVHDGEITLHKQLEFSINVEGTGLPVPEELALDVDLDRARCHNVAVVQEIQEGVVG